MACNRVLVAYEPSAQGREALLHASGIARSAGVPLTVVSVATKVSVDGCLRCRQSAVLWNREMRAIAREALAEAAELLGNAETVSFDVAVGQPARAIGEAADRAGADLVVLPWERDRRVRRPFSSTVVEDLRRPGRWDVIVAPRASG
jgi:nucleotide-binding universal stress UspA family protein